MKLSDNYAFCEGYLVGYRDGLKDGSSGRVEKQDILNVRLLPVSAMGLSTRAHNCLTSMGCKTIADVIAIESRMIAATRNMGPKTASEIANWLTSQGILSSAWSEYI